MMHDHEHLNHINPYKPFLLNCPLHFKYFSNLTMTYKINNMHYMHLILLSDFLQAQYSARKLPINN
jgi:hypothetical protein